MTFHDNMSNSVGSESGWGERTAGLGISLIGSYSVLQYMEATVSV